MPNIVAHYICGKLVAKKLNITDKNYLIGNLIPDYVDIRKHYRIPGKKFEIPDIEAFIKEEKIQNQSYKLGFLTHLILDKLYLDDYILDFVYSKIPKDVNIFKSNEIYNDYTNISNRLLNYYHLDLKDIDTILLPEKDHIDIKKYQDNVLVIRDCKHEDLNYLSVDSFIDFIDRAVIEISNYLKINKFYN